MRLFAFASFLPHYCRVESGYYYLRRRTGRPYCTTIGKGVRRIGKGVRRISVNVRAPRARAHQRRPRHHGLNVFTACDQEFHVVGGGHDALLRHHGAQHRRRCNTGKGFRSTCGRFPSATRSWCVQQRRARPSMFTMGCCITLVTTPVPYGVPRLAMRPFYNVATRRGCGGATKYLRRTTDRNYLPRHVKEWWW